MILRALLVSACAVLGLAGLDAARAGDIEGACGGGYTGRDGQSYRCGPTRKPYCQQDTGRCQCLEKKTCGGKLDEEW